MVVSVWALCSRCEQRINGVIWMPSCLNCHQYIKNYYFHYDCVVFIYSVDHHALIPEFRDVIKCVHCNDHSSGIGFDYRPFD